ncbi:MAG: hypothetical protein ACI4NM_02210 [Bullifex sp.]
MDKNTLIMTASLAVLLIVMLIPAIPQPVKLAIMALAFIIIIWTRRGTFFFVSANKNYMSKDPEKRKKAVESYRKALKTGGLPDNYIISAASVLIQNGEAEAGRSALDALASKSGKKPAVVANAKIAASMACWINHDIDGAVRYIEEVRKTTYRDKNLYINGATYYLEKRDVKAFSELCAEWKSKSMDTPALKDLEAVDEMLKGNWRKAANIINDLLGKKSYTFPDPYVHAAQIKLHYHNASEAVLYLNEAVDRSSFNACSVITRDTIERLLSMLEDEKTALQLMNGNEEDPLALVNGQIPALSDNGFTVDDEEEEKTEVREEKKALSDRTDADTELNDDDEAWLKAHGLS